MKTSQQEDLNQRSERAHAKCQVTTFKTNHDEPWRNIIASQLNAILSRVEYVMGTCIPPDESDIEFAEAALSVVERVANFEDIKQT